jgi:hypothetical protein
VLPAVIAAVAAGANVIALRRLREIAARVTPDPTRAVRAHHAPSRGARRSSPGRVLGAVGVGFAVSAAPTSTAADAALPLAIDAHELQFVPSKSGPVNYYSVAVDASGEGYVHAAYRPPLRTGVLGYEVPESVRSSARLLRWRWRVLAFPKGGDECAAGKEDSAAVVYVIWRHELRFFTLKLAWSTVGPRGAVCDRRRNLMLSQDTELLESGGALDAWKDEELDLRAEFRRHFADGKADAPVPPLVGIGIMSDGDQTESASVADYGRMSLAP